ncbi:MAG: (deoxy)nucleoside triphosphate pyrophosphohydrolase [bacterium]|nr:(deoxy)nucleoside triphosphate pyrophosphohydrolase [bacterium]
MPPRKPRLQIVTAAVIERHGLFLLARRARSDHGPGGWEFPGGKVEPGEDPHTCLARELREELGITVRVGSLLSDHIHHYPSLTIRLLAFRTELLSGEPTPIYHQALAWVTLQDLLSYDLLPADRPVVHALLAAHRPS